MGMDLGLLLMLVGAVIIIAHAIMGSPKIVWYQVGVGVALAGFALIISGGANL